MKKIKRKWDLLTEKERKNAINEIIDFFETEREKKIGLIAAENILDMFLQNTGVILYNKGIEDSKEFVKESLEGLAVDMDFNLKK